MVTFTATATGDLLTYEWFVGTDKVEGVTVNSHLNDVTLDQAGRVQVLQTLRVRQESWVDQGF